MTPQAAAAEAFLTAWSRRDWDAMHAGLQVRRRTRTTPEKLEAIFGMKAIATWRLLGMRETSHATIAHTEDGPAGAMLPEMVSVAALVTYRLLGRKPVRRMLTLNVVREGPDGQPARPGEPAEWGVNEVSALRERPLPR